MDILMRQKVTDRKHRLALIASRLEGLSPLKRLSKGFGFLTVEDGKRVESAKQVKTGQALTVRLSDGTLKTEITEVIPLRS